MAQKNEDRDAAKALRSWARAITTNNNAHELRQVSRGRRTQNELSVNALATPSTHLVSGGERTQNEVSGNNDLESPSTHLVSCGERAQSEVNGNGLATPSTHLVSCGESTQSEVSGNGLGAPSTHLVSCGESTQNGVSGNNGLMATPVATHSPTVTTTVGGAAAGKQTSELALDVARGEKISDLPPPPAAEEVGLSVDGVSLEGWLEKLAGERRKWMVTLYRATRRSSKRPVDKPRQKTQESSPSKQRIVPAADFCCDCGKIVDVRLESTAAGGVFVAEHRSGCSSCGKEQQRRVL